MFEATSGVFTGAHFERCRHYLPSSLGVVLCVSAEVQPGSYILHDCDYARNEDAEGQQVRASGRVG
jgi:hypothetical protein